MTSTIRSLPIGLSGLRSSLLRSASFTTSPHVSSSARRSRAFLSRGLSTSPTPNARRPTRLTAALDALRARAAKTGSDPASLILSFLFLHELTAIVPLVALFFAFHWAGAGERVLEMAGVRVGARVGDGAEGEGTSGAFGWAQTWVDEGIVRAEKYGRRKGLWGLKDSKDDQDRTVQSSASPDRTSTAGSVKLAGGFADAVAAYAVTKVGVRAESDDAAGHRLGPSDQTNAALFAPYYHIRAQALLPLRIGLSLYAAPPFARLVFEPAKRLVRRATRRVSPPPARPSSSSFSSRSSSGRSSE